MFHGVMLLLAATLLLAGHGLWRGQVSLGLSPWRLLGWSVLCWVGHAFQIALLAWPTELAVNIGGAVVPVAGALVWARQAVAPERRWGLRLAATVAVVGFALWRLLGEGAPAWIAPSLLVGVTAGVAGSLFPVQARTALAMTAVGLVLAQAAASLEMTARAVPVQFTVGGGDGFDTTVIAMLTVAGMALIGGPTGKEGGDRLPLPSVQRRAGSACFPRPTRPGR